MHPIIVASLLAALLTQDPAPRPAADILRDYDRVEMPSMSDGADPESVKRFRDAIDAGCRQKAELALELHRGHPEHARVPELLEVRWAGMTNALGEADAVVAETKAMLGRKDLRADVRTPAMHARARALLASDKAGNVERLKAVRELIAADPENEATGGCLLEFVEQHLGDPETMTPLLEIASERWAKSDHVGRPAKRWLRLLARLGLPFVELLAEEARAPFAAATAEPSKFTVVQLWMGWVRDDGSGKPDPELAALQALRKEHGESVRLIGLLNGDLAERMPEVKKAGVDWPQLEAPDQEPMTSPLGVPRLPCYFVLDAKGNVVGVAGRAASAAARVRQLLGK